MGIDRDNPNEVEKANQYQVDRLQIDGVKAVEDETFTDDMTDHTRRTVDGLLMQLEYSKSYEERTTIKDLLKSKFLDLEAEVKELKDIINEMQVDHE